MAASSDKATPPTPPERLAAWMTQYGPALRRFFVRKVGPTYADDLVQEVFLHLQMRAENAHSDNIERYLFTVAKNVLIDRYRADFSRRANLHTPIDELKEQSDDISPERILAAKQEYERVLVAIVALPPRMRMAFTLHRFSRLSYAAIAKRMKITKGGVQTLMERAIERINQDLEDGQ